MLIIKLSHEMRSLDIRKTGRHTTERYGIAGYCYRYCYMIQYLFVQLICLNNYWSAMLQTAVHCFSQPKDFLIPQET